MASEEMNRVLKKLALLGSCLNVLIDSNQHTGISKDEVLAKIENKTIFQYLATLEGLGWGLDLSEEDKRRLLDEWQRTAEVVDWERKFGLRNNGICILLGLVLEGIQVRAFYNKAWPYT